MPNHSIPEEVAVAPLFGSRKELRAFAAVESAGTRWAEFGVREGKSARHLLKMLKPDGELHLYDSWEGLPDDWVRSDSDELVEITRAGHFACPVPEFDDHRVHLHKGWFADTVDREVGRIDLAHLDCDIYSSTLCVLGSLHDRLDHAGALLLFDDLYGYPEWRAGQWAAMENWLEWKELKGQWIGRTVKGQALWRSHGTR